MDNITGKSELDKEVTWRKAISICDASAVVALINAGYDINTKDELGWAALHIAAWNGFTTVARLLLTCPSCDVNVTGPGDVTPLFLSVQRGHLDIVRLLVNSKRCDVTRKCTINHSDDVTALHLAAQGGYTDICRLLLCRGSDVNACMRLPDVTSVTPLHLAVERNHLGVMDLLLSNGGDVEKAT